MNRTGVIPVETFKDFFCLSFNFLLSFQVVIIKKDHFLVVSIMGYHDTIINRRI